jgi:hypothetical protein
MFLSPNSLFLLSLFFFPVISISPSFYKTYYFVFIHINHIENKDLSIVSCTGFISIATFLGDFSELYFSKPSSVLCRRRQQDKEYGRRPEESYNEYQPPYNRIDKKLESATLLNLG